jgi:hypothetical protein
MKDKFFLWVFVFFLLGGSMVLAVPPSSNPVQSSYVASTLTVIYPKFEYYMGGVPVNFHVHVHNSTGFLLNKSLVNCSIHVYNSTEHHVLEAEMVGDSNGVDLYATLNSSVMSVGHKSFIVWCVGNSPQSEAGFVSGSFQVTIDGESKDELSGGFLGVLVLIPLLFGFLLMFWNVSLDSEEHPEFKMGLSLLSAISVWVSLHLGLVVLIRLFDFPALQSVIGTTMYWLVWLFFAFLSYWLINYIVAAFETARKKKIERLRY